MEKNTVLTGKISIIVPVYNVEKYLKRCIVSIQNQTYSNFELILVDDGSPDNCGQICDEYAEKDARIHVIHKENSGVSDARNVGIDWSFEHSDSEWITFIDSDDWIHRDYLSALYNACVENHVEISMCGDYATDEYFHLPTVESLDVGLVSPDDAYFFSGAVVLMRKLYKKSLFNNIRFPYGKIHEDEYVTYKLLFSLSWIAYIKAPLYYYFLSPDSIMRASWTPKHLDVNEAYKEQLEFFKQIGNDYVLTRIVENYANSLFQNYHNANENGYFKEAVLCKSELRAIINQYKNDLSLKKYSHLYEVAFPYKMKVYWTIKGLQNKLNKG